jgi:DNA invertase Pin-like site-specific DNA recombinase
MRCKPEAAVFVLEITMPVQAIVLCRVSTPGQKRDGNLDPQIERVNKAAVFLGAEIVRRWEIAASSRKGKNVKRKDLLEMQEYCRHNKRVKYLIVDEVDRFMRSIDEYYYWKVKFKNIGVQLVHANKPDVDPDNQGAVFDELIDVYKAEQSNNERITKTPEKQMSKMRAGYYPFPPLPGFKTSSVKSLHDRDPERFYLLQTAFKSVANGSATPNEALKRMNKAGYVTTGGNPFDMEQFKRVAVKPYYAGIIQVSDWGVATENGLHTPYMLTKLEHEALKTIISGKGKKFAVNKKNPAYPMNETLCYDCQQEAMRQYKLTGYRNHNGKTKELENRQYYERYRCRGCNTHFTKDDLHQKVSSKLDSTVLDDRDMLIQELKTLWRSRVSTNQQKVAGLKSREHLIEAAQSQMAGELAATSNETVKKALVAAIESKEQEKLAIQADIKAYSDVDTELEDFIAYSIDYTERLKAKYWSLDWDRRKRCELLLYPDGFFVTRQKKVYTPRVSPIYRDKTMKKEPQMALNSVNSLNGGASVTLSQLNYTNQTGFIYQLDNNRFDD